MKSTAIQDLLDGEIGVSVEVDFDFDIFSSAVLDGIDQTHVPQGITATGFLRSTLVAMKNVYTPLLFLVELDERCTGGDLEKLLLAAKAWGYEAKLARFIFVLSTSRAAFGSTIGMYELREECIAVGDLSESEAR